MMYSGGLDSEYALSVFLSQGMDVIPVIVRLLPHYNDHDTKYAISFCESKNITPVIVDIDFDEFVHSGTMLDLCMQMNSCVHHYAVLAHVSGLLDGTVILGDGEPVIEYRDNAWKVVVYEYDHVVANYFRQNNLYGTPFFNQYTPGMLAAFLMDPNIAPMVLTRPEEYTTSDRTKLMVYNADSGFNLTYRPKYHGYETISTSDIGKHADFSKLRDFAHTCKSVVCMDYFQLVSNYVD